MTTSSLSIKKKILINKDISIAETMPADFYLEGKYYNAAIENIFKNSWQFVIHKDSLNSKVMPFSFLRDSIDIPLILSNSYDELKCLSNVCTHRGNILCNKGSNRNTIKCSYHGRTFDLDGTIKNMPGFKGVKNFPSSKDNLKEINILDWNKIIFCSISEGFSIKEILDDISYRLKDFPFDSLIYNKENSNEYIVNFHWALYCENYLEGFHIPYVHKGLNSDISIESYTTEIIENGVLQFTKTKNGLKYAYYWIFPNMMFNFYDWGLSINIVEPITKEKTRIRFLSFPIKGKIQPLNTDSSLDKVEKEDQLIVKSVQRGIKSKFYDRGRYSVKHEKGVHHFHRLLARFLS